MTKETKGADFKSATDQKKLFIDTVHYNGQRKRTAAARCGNPFLGRLGRRYAAHRYTIFGHIGIAR